ncbi:MFS general substrate transporter [Gymnopilus junonius]|uniref:MFS general substrate transporter n=1 Tax=Gymnopilus junonius TaxID=109634 RepID=A0A9P5TPA0_GYMJU|nr:MFS general substrate transporter [Gymnopilus junonius]
MQTEALTDHEDVKSRSPEFTSKEHSIDDSSSHIDPDEERRLVRKLDIVLLPLFTLICEYPIISCCLFSEGNARIAGLEKDLGMKGFDFNIALTTFYISFMIIDIPANLALKHFGPTFMAFMVFSFGIIAIGSAFVKSFGALLATRVLLGFAEGGTLSGLVYLLARYYRRREFVLRVGIFFGLSPTLAGAFGGLLASGLLSVHNFGQVTRWRKIFLIEGILTSGIGVFLFFFMPADPTKTRLLNERERVLAIARLNADQVVKTSGKKERTSFRLVLHSFSFNTILCMISYIMINISFQGLSLFLPTVINSLGHYSTVEAQLRTVPPYMVGAAWALFAAWISYRMKQRCIPIFSSVCLQVVGYAIAISTKNPHARYAACFLSVAGGSPSGPMYLTWATDNSAPDTMRAVTTAVVSGFGQLGSVIAVWTYLPTDSPDYHHGNTLNLSTSVTVCFITLLGGWYILRENEKRTRGERDYRLSGKTHDEMEQLGYLHPKFRYQL